MYPSRDDLHGEAALLSDCGFASLPGEILFLGKPHLRAIRLWLPGLCLARSDTSCSILVLKTFLGISGAIRVSTMQFDFTWLAFQLCGFVTEAFDANCG